MRFLSLLVVLLCLLCAGCSDDTETPKDGGADVEVVEAGSDAVGDLPATGDSADPDAAGDTGAGEQTPVSDASPEGGGDQ
jgi:hypothetical protein